MTIPSTLQGYLRKAGVKPQTVAHPKTLSASRTAQVCHVSGDCVAKGVLVKDAEGYLLAVIPASHHIEMDRLSRLTGRALRLADEDEVADVFPDCSLGAVPAVGAPYGLEFVVDDSIARQTVTLLAGGAHAPWLQVPSWVLPRPN